MNQTLNAMASLLSRLVKVPLNKFVFCITVNTVRFASEYLS